MAERRMPRGLLDPESEAIAEAYEASPAVRRQLRGLLDVVQRAFSLEPQEQTAGDTALDVVGGLVPGVSQAMALRDIERARRAGDPAGMAMAATEFVPFGRVAGMMRGPGPIMSELDVYHGTPHRFPATEANPLGEFDASKIGTGEGAQAYGHGIYYAENPTVAQGYKTANELTNTLIDGKQIDFADPRYQAAVRISTHGYKDALDMAIKEAQSEFLTPEGKAKRLELAEQIKALKGSKVGSETTGSLYKADLPDEMIDRMLDWDKPLSEQPAVFQELMKMTDLTGTAGYIAKTPETTTFGELYQALTNQIPQKDVSEYFRNAGIPGIKYLDAGSRGQGGSGTRNFVVFPGEEKKVKILERK